MINKNKKINKLYNLISYNSIKNTIKVTSLINCFDYFLLTIVIFTLLGDCIDLLSNFINSLIDLFNINSLDLIHNLTDSNSIVNTNNNTTNTTNTTIIHDDGSWSNGIRTLAIYGSGAYRLSIQRSGGTPGSRLFVYTTTLLADVSSRILNNTINDPNYVKNHHASWRSMWLDSNTVKVEVDSETTSKLEQITKSEFIGGDGGLGNLPELLIKEVFDKLKFILEPVQVNYSNELLSNQIYDISIILFVLSILIFGLIVVLLFNILLYINMDRFIKIFKNKFIIWYLILNKKFLGVEIFLLGGSILYFMNNLITGIRFIATHPIIIN